MPVIGVGSGVPYVVPYGATAAVALTAPAPAVPGLARPRPVFARDAQGNVYIAGYFSRPAVFTVNWDLLTCGILQPSTIPTLALAAGSGGSSGRALGYITYTHEKNGRIVQESNPAGPTGDGVSLAATGQGYTWSALPTSPADSRVTHINGYRSMDGALPRLVWKREIAAAVASLTENVLTLDRGRTLPTRIDDDGEISLDVNARGAPPFTRGVSAYHDSAYWWGDPAHPDRIYPSKIFEFESVNIDEEDGTFLRTKRGEAVIGCIHHPGTDALLVFCDPEQVYAITGYGPDDREMNEVPGGAYQLLSAQSLALVGPTADVYAAVQEGVVSYDGTFRWLMEDWETYWQDLLEADPSLLAKCWAVQDRREHGYKLNIPQASDATNKSFYFFGHYQPVRGGGQPDWFHDIRTREDTCAAQVREYGKPYAEVWTGSADGYIRRENVQANGDDDDDTYDKVMDWTTPHEWLPDQEGDDAHGATITDADVFIKNQDDDVTIYIYAGDDSASDAVLTAVYTKTLKATRVATGQRQRVAQTSHHLDSVQVSGKGAAMRGRVTNPVGVEWRGYALHYRPGPQTRPFSE